MDINSNAGFLSGAYRLWFALPLTHACYTSYDYARLYILWRKGICGNRFCCVACRVALFRCLKLGPGCLALIGIDCSSWGVPARGTTLRSSLNNAVGLTGRSMVYNGSKMASRFHGLNWIHNPCSQVKRILYTC